MTLAKCERYTPPTILNLVRKIFPIDLDPASCRSANHVVKAKRYVTQDDDGVVQEWHGNGIIAAAISNVLSEKLGIAALLSVIVESQLPAFNLPVGEGQKSVRPRKRNSP